VSGVVIEVVVEEEMVDVVTGGPVGSGCCSGSTD